MRLVNIAFLEAEIIKQGTSNKNNDELLPAELNISTLRRLRGLVNDVGTVLKTNREGIYMVSVDITKLP